MRANYIDYLHMLLVCVRHAGVYTAEEVALIAREKLIRLQSLYIDQFKRLQHLLKEKKRRYLHSRKVEHETLGEGRMPAWLALYCVRLTLNRVVVLLFFFLAKYSKIAISM